MTETLAIAASVANITFPIAALVALGYICVRTDYISAQAIPHLSQFASRVALPAALFLVIATQQISTVLDPDFLIVYGSATIACAAVLFVCLMLIGQGVLRSSLGLLGGLCCNCMMVGLPITILLFDPATAAVMAIVSFFQDVLLLPVVLVIADSAAGNNWRKTLWRTIGKTMKNPFIIAILAALVVSASGTTLPVAGLRVVELLAAALAGAGLFMIGGLLAKTRLSTMSWSFLPVVTTKLLLHPAIVAFAFWMFPIQNESFMLAAVLAASLPTISLYPVISAQYVDAESAATAMFVSTVASFFTITAIAVLLIH